MSFVNKNTSLEKCTGYFYEGKEIALTKQVGPKVRSKTSWQPEEKRIEAATIFAVTKDLNATEELTGIPRGILKTYVDKPWWSEIISKVKKEKNELLDAKISQILENSLDQIEDRINDGEYYIDRKTKAVTRIPVRTKDLAMATDILFDKRQLIRGEATVLVESITTEQRLLQLKENFERLAVSKGINPNGEIIDGGITDVSETREEESPEGEMRGSTGPEEAGRLLSTQSEGQEVNVLGKTQTQDKAQTTPIPVSAWKEETRS